MSEQQKLNEFEPVTYEAWRELTTRDLDGAPFEKKLVKRVAGVDIQPLYTRAQIVPDGAGLPGFAPFTRGAWPLGAVEMGWDVRCLISQASPKAAGSAVLEELSGGASSIALRLDRSARAGSGERGEGGIALVGLADLETVLEHVRLENAPVSFDAGVSAAAVAAGFVAVAQKHRVKLAALAGTFGADPLGTLAAYGSLPGSLEHALAELSELAAFAHEHSPLLRAVRVGTEPYHDAGADAPTEIGIALATGVAYLRALTAAGLDVNAAARQITFGFSIGRDVFVEIAKLRAARRTWAKVVKASGGDEDAQAMVVHARTSLRTKTQRDPWVNLLRATAESFAAAAGGADAITTSPFDEAIGTSDEFARRLARNTQHLLRHESSLNRVVDPGGGSFYIETLTEELAKRAWSKLQTLERAGGMAQAITSGSIQKELGEALAAERKAVETRKLPITGVNEFPNVREDAVVRAAPAFEAGEVQGKAPAAFEAGKRIEQAAVALASGASFAEVTKAWSGGAPVSCPPLVQERLSQPFESLRDGADQYARRAGTRPSVFLANLGPIPEHKARAAFAQNFFEAGGFVALTNDGYGSPSEAAAAFALSGAKIAVLCSSDTVYGELAEATAKALTEKGAKAVVLAGNPGDKEGAYKAAGVSDFIYMGMNVYASLRSLLERAGAV